MLWETGQLRHPSETGNSLSSFEGFFGLSLLRGELTGNLGMAGHDLLHGRVTASLPCHLLSDEVSGGF
ncbi:hypothetical protein D3C72_2342170 [compost metagenome]